MDKRLLVTILAALEAQNDVERGPKGKQGPKGRRGDDPNYDLIFEAITKEVYDQVIKQDFTLHNLSKKQTEKLKLKFSDLSKEEKDELRLKFDSLSSSQIRQLKGRDGKHGKDGIDGKDGRDGKDLIFDELTPIQLEKIKGDQGRKGRDGKNGRDGIDGKDFNFEESKDAISSIIKLYVEHIKDTLKLKFSDLSEDDKDSLRGRRGFKGQKGSKGKDFIFSDNKVEISQVITNFIDSIKDDLMLRFSDLTKEEQDSLKLKFDDLTDDEQLSLRGKRGPVGPKGRVGLQGEDGKTAHELWKLAGNEGDVNDFLISLKGIRGLPGSPGPAGRDGIDGQDGEDGQDAPFIVDVELRVRGKKFFFRFHFSDGMVIDTNEIDLPKGKSVINQTAMGGGGRINWLSLKTTYVDCNLTRVDYYYSLTQSDIYRLVSVELSYVGDNLDTEAWKIYDRKDGTTVLSTTTIAHFYDVDDMLIRSQKSVA